MTDRAVERESRPDFEPADFSVLRTPLLPFDELVAFGAGLTAARAHPERVEAALAEDRVLLRARLRAIVARPEVREALFVASPSLHESLGEWFERPDSERGQKVERTLVRYFERMAARSTPFGLFAGCSIASLAGSTRLELAPRRCYQRRTRLDMDYLLALSEALPRDPALRPNLRFRPNSSLYRAAGRLRYAQARIGQNGRTYHLVAVEPTDYLLSTLERAASGARPPELAAALVDDETSVLEAEEYVDELIESQILVSELAPPLTGSRPFHAMLAPLRDHPAAAKVVQRLDEADAAMDALDDAGIGADPERYLGVAHLLAELPATVELPRLFQVDMFKPVIGAHLGGAVLREIIRGVALLHRSTNAGGDALRQFADEFARRYGDREVPLVEALDEESGIGFERSSALTTEASPLLAGILFPPAAEGRKVSWGAREQFLLRKLEQAWHSDAAEIALADADFEALGGSAPVPPLPDSFAVMATVIAASDEALAQGEFRVHVHSVFGPSGARMLGRFCHGDPALAEALIRHLHAEEALDPEAVFAEIVHLPEGRLGNVLLRSVLREHEIPYLGRSAVPLDKQVPIDDLQVSVHDGGLVVLRSRRLGRRVVPRLSAAHNFHGPENLSLYRFLGSLQEQSTSGRVFWSWAPFDRAQFLPRLTSGRVILSPARWHVCSEDLESLAKARNNDRFQRAQALRQDFGLPRFVALADSDNTLPVDFENALSIDAFAHLVKDRTSATLIELSPPPDALCAHGPEGRFAHELVIPMLRRRAVTPPKPTRPRRPTGVRRFAPGSEWLYAKLYAGTSSVDHVLSGLVAELVAGFADAFDLWFFVRYADPDWHLRLRFHGEPRCVNGELRHALEARSSSVLGDGCGWRLQLDTYEREVERYGGDEGIALSERIFHADSEAVLGIVALLSGDEGSDARWRLTLRGIDALLDDLKLDLPARRRVIGRMRKAAADEFRFVGRVERQLHERYRKHRRELEALLDRSRDEMSDLAPAIEVLHRRSERLRPVLAELEDAARAGRLSCTIEDLATSYVHMHANRLLRSAQRAQELLIYDFLERLYESAAARAGASSRK